MKNYLPQGCPSGTSMRHILATLFVLSPLLAHAANYQEPTGDSTASIEFVNDSAKNMSIHIYGDSKECTDRANTYAKGGERKKLAVVAGRDLAITTTIDPNGAGALFAFGALGAGLGANMFKGCRPTLVFHPEPAHTYVMQMNSDGKDCAFKFVEKPVMEGDKTNTESAQPVEDIHVAFEEREFTRAWGESGPWCKKKAEEPSK